jgi:spore germination protein KC
MKLSWIYLIMIPFLLYGSYYNMNHIEIDDIDIIRVLGIDKEKDQYILSGLYNENGGVDQSVSGVKVIEARGNSLYQAYENLKEKNKKTVTLAHTSYFLIGDEAARDGINESMDFIIRDETIKTNASIYILKDMQVLKLLNGTKEKDLFIHNDLDAISQKQLEQKKKNSNQILKIQSKLENPDSTVLVPYLFFDNEYLYIKGYSVFEKGKLYSYLDNKESIGIDLIHDNIRMLPLYINDSLGLSASNVKTKLKTDIKNKKISITINTSFETNTKEMNSKEGQMNEKTVEELTHKQNEYMKNIMEKSMEYAKKTDIDIIGLRELIEIDSISDIEYDIQLNSKTLRNYMIGR